MSILSIIIPALNEEFIQRTIESILENSEADTEVIAVLDGYWPNPPLKDHPKVTLIHHPKPIGQRASVNEGVRLSKSKYVMKMDAHCAVAKGFDRQLIADSEYNWTIVPFMYNLHAFDVKCMKCGNRIYQQPKPAKCEKCDNVIDFENVMVWRPRRGRKTFSWRFDKNLQFQYWHGGRNRPEIKPGIMETMSFIGAYWFIDRERYWELDGLDENHGGWGQVGTEISCKSWLSGGKVVTDKNTWIGHYFRTQFGWPYRITQGEINRARAYSRDYWYNNKWPKQKYPLSWLVDYFKPVPDWHEEAK